ncbi:NUDIX family hydrolase [Natranaeroarchaeum sulfidigenes]|uniref:NUDIX family hydrolase n=2 Tax=Natranaeroarchaeum sulfidigenes TaxID=2784880 RepID=A0A897MZD8_9EURY|nr:NUDIX family hydrolase [Natranaeroarchaeum sulfidigenes]
MYRPMDLDLERVAAYDPRAITDERHDAAVLVPVIDRDGESHLLFTKRADHLGEHPGQMSFPGGGREPRDADSHETALREANEEIALDPADAGIVGRLDDIRTITEYAVTPVVARVPDRQYVPDESEVAEIVVLPVSGLLDPDNYEFEARDHPHYGEIVIHYFHVDGYTVWGATGRIVVDFLERTTDWRAPERIDRDIA